MKILLWDTELAPNLATVWGIWNQNIGLNQLLETSRLICYAAKWYGEKEVIFDSEHQSDHEDMVRGLHKLLDEADAVVTYNGDKFDRGVINREFLLYGIEPPTPYHSIDLLRVVKKRFRFVSNKLDNVCNELGLGGKVKHEGHELWLKCMDGEDKAWGKMEKYNKQDVKLLEKLYKKLLPWIQNHPNHGLYTNTDRPVCTNCGSTRVEKCGTYSTKEANYQRYRCKSCWTPMRAKQMTDNLEKRKSILTQAKI